MYTSNPTMQGFGSYMQTATANMPSASSLAILILVAIIAYFTASRFFYGQYTVPLPSYKSGFVGSEAEEAEAQEAAEEAEEEEAEAQEAAEEAEGFRDVVKESFTIPKRTFITPPASCLSADASAILQTFSGRTSITEEGNEDLLEMKNLLNKLSCFQKDLASSKFAVNATLRQPFITSHDIEPISETTGRCFAKTLPPRDLDMAMDKWITRGSFLILRLCSSFSLKDSEASKLEESFQACMRTIYDLAREKCLQQEPLDVSKRGPRDPHPFSVKTDAMIGEYTGYY